MASASILGPSIPVMTVLQITGGMAHRLLTFYRDGEIVHTELVTSDAKEGDFTFNRDEFIADGFDQVIVSAVDNKSDPNSKENMVIPAKKVVKFSIGKYFFD